MWFDSHCHLWACEGGPHPALARARAAEVDAMLVCGTDLESSRASIALAGETGVHAAAGVHPNECAGWDDELAAEVETLVADPRVVAVGETGLDFYRNGAPEAVQRAAFAAHIEIARRARKTLVVHTRSSVDAAIAALRAAEAPERVVFHCWSGDEDALRRALDLGAFVSFAGNISFPSAGDLRTAAALVPRDRLLVETDSPYLAPHAHRGKPNEPAFVALVGRALAEARAGDPADVAALTATNARAVLEVGG